MRTTPKPVHQWTTAEVENQRRSSIQKWLFWAMFVWPVIMMVVVGVFLFGQFADYVLFLGSPVVAAILAGFALRHYPATRKSEETGWFPADHDRSVGGIPSVYVTRTPRRAP